MWHIQFSRRDFIEFWLGSTKNIKNKAQRVTGFPSFASEKSEISAYWSQEPSSGYIFPNLVVVQDNEISDLFTALNSSPQAPAPASAFCRFLTVKEAENYFISPPMDLSEDILSAIVSLAMAEAVLHSEGKISWRQLSPAACRRTLSYAWGKALAARAPSESFQKLPSRWIDTYSIINSQSANEPVRRTISGAIGALSAYAKIVIGLPPTDQAGSLAYALQHKDRKAIENHWKQVCKSLGSQISLEGLSQSTREERAAHLQQALRLATSSPSDELASSACAFIATQVAPGSLEHLDLLRQSGNPSVVFWYALYAALQTPNEIMAAQSGLGYRIYRDIAKTEEHLSEPTGDIAFEELKAIERSGIDSFSKKFGHTNEVEVELIPLITSSFTFYSKQSKGSRYESPQQTFPEAETYQPNRRHLPHRAQLEQVISSLMQIARDLPDGDDGYISSSYRKSTKKRP
ncbi:TPA: hypothetical protein ACHH76_003847 [Pseudomonas aeruginosa]|uniref:hypothetical protein n=1 Tax=Pseudomonas aeruginosa TaxID=287 RepID=UPI00104E561F|nr:hypothetical protein [Pseudomonas aeruginosa]MBX5868070.1 hypothetical protein [Pseudomonas aeruginosa]HEP8409907.1 hypothetical protein [Pseudomonas aeruginosa]